jgi:hypothetical protein
MGTATRSMLNKPLARRWTFWSVRCIQPSFTANGSDGDKMEHDDRSHTFQTTETAHARPRNPPTSYLDKRSWKIMTSTHLPMRGMLRRCSLV